MVIYYKSDSRAKKELGLWRVALENNIKPEEVLWKCRGKCYNKKLRDPPMTKHIRLVFPSGTIKYVCIDCGSSVVFDNKVESNLDVVEEHERESFILDYDAFTKQMKTNMRDRRKKPSS